MKAQNRAFTLLLLMNLPFLSWALCRHKCENIQIHKDPHKNQSYGKQFFSIQRFNMPFRKLVYMEMILVTLTCQ